MRSTALSEHENLRLLKSYTSAAPSAELSHKVEALRILATALLREVETLSQAATAGDYSFNLNDEVQRFESELIRSALISTNGRLRQAARLLGMKVTTLHGKIKRYEIDFKE